MDYRDHAASPNLASITPPASGTFTSAADITVPERFETGHEIAAYCFGVQYAEAGLVGSGGHRDDLDNFSMMYPWEAHAFSCGARSVAGAGEPMAYSAYEARHLSRQPKAYGEGWSQGPDALNGYGEENLTGGEFQAEALAFEAGQSARRTLETSFGAIPCSK